MIDGFELRLIAFAKKRFAAVLLCLFERKIHGVVLLIDCPLVVSPLAFYLDVGLIESPTSTDRSFFLSKDFSSAGVYLTTHH